MAKKVAVLIADGCEEIEALTPVDVLRRAGIQCDMVGLDSLDVMGAHQIALKCDKVLDDSDCSKCKYLKVCNGGCIGMSYHYFKKIGMGDYRCPLINKTKR